MATDKNMLPNSSVADPDPVSDLSDPYVFGPPGSGSRSIKAADEAVLNKVHP